MDSCFQCPSFLNGDEAVREFFGVDFGPGVDGCARFGHVLGKPALAESAVLKVHSAFARNCPDPGARKPERKSFPQALVASPSADVFIDANGSPVPPPSYEAQAAVKNCSGCANFIPAHVVNDELGWTLPLCAATGRLLFPDRQRREPKECGQARPGANRDSTDGLHLVPMYEDAFSFTGTVTVASEATFEVGAFIEPNEYETDLPVEPIDAADGVRAWRVLTHPKDPTKKTRLPIFRPDFFEPAEAAKIPRTGDLEHPEWYVDHDDLVYRTAAILMELDRTPALVGPAGTGKTELFRHLAWLCQMPFDRISITGSSEVDDLVGKWIFRDGETTWTDGRLVRRWERPGVLLVDEPNVGPDEVWQLIRPLTDNSKQMVLDQAEGRHVERNHFCFFGLAMNPSWDMKYVGANETSDADGNRLSWISVAMPPPEVERDLLRHRCVEAGYEIPAETLDKIMSIAEEIRVLTDPLEGTLQVSWGIRPQLAVAEATRAFTLVEAYKLAVVDRLEPSAGETILRIVEGYDA